VNILNENNYSLEDCILIIRTFLIKAKRLAKLIKVQEETKNLELTISGFKPPIFWKEKEIVKQQLRSWSLSEFKKIIYQINEIELLIKKHNNSSISILFDFGVTIKLYLLFSSNLVALSVIIGYLIILPALRESNKDLITINFLYVI
jgi:hypothetical protein